MENKFHLILNNINYSIILFNEELTIEFLNIAAQEFTGYSDSYANHLNAGQFFHNNKYIIAKINEIAKTGEGFIDFDFEFYNNNRQNNKRSIIIEIAKINYGERYYILISMKDITRFKEMDNIIRNEEKSQNFSRFIAEISHEIRNPLSGVKASASYLKKKIIEEQDSLPESLKELTQFTEIIVKEINRINFLIEDLLALSKNHKINAEMINVNKIINEIIEIEATMNSDKNIKFIKEFDPSLPEIFASDGALKQVFLNIIKNSIVAIQNKNKGFIRITTRIDAERNSPKFIKIILSDNGAGISKKDLDKLFEPFFTTKEKGTGLGLAISQKIIFEHSGFIDIKSVKNRGTDVVVYLPIGKNKKIGN
ncbi:MAG: ATP-binding protein [Deltaproteobacteria bacterium]|nr:ATP-binding protein [Deltaproteobacteria bacterium]